MVLWQLFCIISMPETYLIMDNNQFPFFDYTDIFSFSHLRWGFVYQRPQHLLTRFANFTRVFYMEEPIFHDDDNRLEINKQGDKDIYVLVPYLKHGLSHEETNSELEQMIEQVIKGHNVECYWAWYYTPMALNFTRSLRPGLVVYDCMDELSAFKFAPPELKEKEQELLSRADVVFTGGHSIYQAKKDRHPNIHPFPSSIDKAHFAQARQWTAEPQDQAVIPHPRFGFFGVIDERFDINLIEKVARLQPDWHFILLGPVVKINPQMLPKLDNIHYLGGKQYNELPHYLAGWDIAIIPFANNESTKFISPTKTPEYLAGGKPVISTPITDVVDPYGKNDLVYIVNDPEEFICAGTFELSMDDKAAWLAGVDEFLKDNSWDNTWLQMVNTAKKKFK
jgi:glycosyltransferase involved in cell wall biosynthesis